MDGDPGVCPEEPGALSLGYRVTKDIADSRKRGVCRPKEAELGWNDGFRDGEDLRHAVDRVVAGLNGAHNGVLDGQHPPVGCARGDRGGYVGKIPEWDQIDIAAPELVGRLLTEGAQFLLVRNLESVHL